MDSIEKDGGAAGADLSCGKGLQGLVDEAVSALAVESIRHLNTDLLRASGTFGAGVVVAERASAHGGRLAMEPAGHDVTAFVDHEFLSCG